MNHFLLNDGPMKKALESTALGVVIWITGLPNSGKTTLANKLYEIISPDYPNTIKLDGDELRAILNKDGVYDYDSRKELSKIYSNLSQALSLKGFNVIISTVSLFHEIHIKNRSNMPRYIEVYLKSDMPTLLWRDHRKIYSHGDNVLGIHITPEFPMRPDVIIDSNDHNGIDSGLIKIINLYKRVSPNEN